MKIALVGSAPSSVALAPYDDETWTIWGCSPGAHRYLKRVDRFFEIHRFAPADWEPAYVDWLKGLECPVEMIAPVADIPCSTALPVSALIERFGRNFFTSSLAWMAALAIVEIMKERKSRVGEGFERLSEAFAEFQGQPPTDEIGFWGVDMAATEEWGHQKPGTLYFIQKAQELGIKVVTPPQSDLLRPLPLYGIGEADPMRIKLEVRRAELQDRFNQATAKANGLKDQWESAMREILFFQGALEDNQYMLNTWCD